VEKIRKIRKNDGVMDDETGDSTEKVEMMEGSFTSYFVL